MNIDVLRYFITLSEAGSFYQASRKLFISQQGLNKSITALERELETKLVERGHRGITLTEDGRILLRHARIMLSNYNSLLSELFDSKHRASLGGSPIRIHISYYAAQIAATDIDYVNLLTNSAYIEAPFKQLLEHARVSDGSDLIFLDLHARTSRELDSDPNLLFEPVITTQVGIVWKGALGLEENTPIAPAEVCDMPFAANAFREIRLLNEQVFADCPLTDVRMKATSPHMLFEYMQTAPGTLALFDSFAMFCARKNPSMPTQGLHFAPLDVPAAMCDVGFLRPRSAKLTPQARHVVDLLKQYLNANCSEYFAAYPTRKG